MAEDYISEITLPQFDVWDRFKNRRIPLSFNLELTARCNNNCRHCYINQTVGNKQAIKDELTLAEIDNIADQAVSLGSLWCLITGGEPLLRKDFTDIYIALKKKGLLVSVFTNACLITDDHIRLFKKYPPRDIEITVYGVTKETYEKVSRVPGSYIAFRNGLDLLIESQIKVRLKAMALRSNLHELPDIARFCRSQTKDYFRFDPFLHLRFDRNEQRNREIISERLSPLEIVELEQGDRNRAEALLEHCDELIISEFRQRETDYLFLCGAGNNRFDVTNNGYFRLCPSLWHPDCIYDLRKGSLADAWNNFVPKVRAFRSSNKEFLEKCRKCPIFNLCPWCPAHAYLESGQLDTWCEYFCDIAYARAEVIKAKNIHHF